MILKDRIRKLRKERNWTQTDLAKQIKVEMQQINRYENGGSTPSVDALANLARVFGVTMDYLFFGELTAQAKSNLVDTRLLAQFEIVQTMPPSKKELIKEMLDGLIIKDQVTTLGNNQTGKK